MKIKIKPSKILQDGIETDPDPEYWASENKLHGYITLSVLTNLFRTDHWLSERSKNSNYKIIKSADSDYGLGKLAMSEKELDVFVEAFSNGGFEAPCNWYRNISING